MVHFSYLGEESRSHTQAPALEYGTQFLALSHTYVIFSKSPSVYATFTDPPT